MDRKDLIGIANELMGKADLSSIKITENRSTISYDNGVMLINEPSGIVSFTIEGSYYEKVDKQ